MITNPMTDGRLADTNRRRERLLTAINTAAAGGGGEISVSGIARAAGVHRTFIYRHPDLLQLVHAAQTTPAPPREADASAAVSLASLRADLAMPVAAPPARTPASSSSSANSLGCSETRSGPSPDSAAARTSSSSNARSRSWKNAWPS